MLRLTGEMMGGLYFNILDDLKIREESNVIDWEREQEERERQKIIKASGIPLDYLGCSLSNFRTDTNEDKVFYNKVKNCYDKLLNGENVSPILLGGFGTGKTHLGTGLLNDYTKDGAYKYYDITFYPKVKYILADTLREKYQASSSFDAPLNQEDLITLFSNYDLLCIDEIGRGKNPKEADVLYKIINERYNTNRSTILISNLERLEFAQYLGGAIVDRLKKGGVWINADGVRSKR